MELNGNIRSLLGGVSIVNIVEIAEKKSTRLFMFLFFFCSSLQVKILEKTYKSYLYKHEVETIYICVKVTMIDKMISSWSRI